MVTAQATGKRIEDLSQGDESTRVFANPDGSWTADTASGPQRVRDEEGEWEPVDTTLVKVGDRVVPTASVVEMSLSAGGDKVFADAVPVEGAAKDELAWRWPTVLPEPVLDGSTATYVDAVPGGGDLVVTATPTGFTHNIVLHEVPASLTGAGATASEAPVFEVPVVTPGAKLEAAADGSLEVVDQTGSGKGDDVATAPAPLMWDSSVDPASGDPVVEQVGVSVENTTASNGTAIGTIALAPSAEFLTDPDTVYPVTIDPTFQLITSFDTWISTNYPTSQSGSTILRAGTKDGVNKARSFLVFPGDATWDGTQIVSANLIMRNITAGSCTAGALHAARITEAWWSSSLTMSNQPAVSSPATSYSPAHGGGASCPADEATWDVKALVQGWADNTYSNHGIRVAAAVESNANTFREYRSLEHGIDRPRIVTTYNRYPNKPSSFSVSDSTGSWVRSRNPKLSAVVSDPDGGAIKARFNVYNSAGTLVYSANGTTVSSGGTSVLTLPANQLAEGTTYTIRAFSYDGNVLSGKGTTAGSLAAVLAVDTIKPSATVTASAYTDGQWLTTPPANNIFALNGAADVARFDYVQDSALGTVAANSTGDATLSWNPTAGAHRLSAAPIDKAGNIGESVSFGFGVGSAAFAAPSPSARSTGVFPIEVTGPPNATAATVSWRYAGSTAWNPAGEITKAGSAWAGEVSEISDGSGTTTGDLLWNADAQEDPEAAEHGDTVKSPALLELRACFTYASGSSDVCSTTRQVELVPSAFDADSPTTEVGPATIALSTGEVTISEPDAADSQAGIGRTFSSFDASTAQAGPFGPGWSLNVDASEASSANLIDNRLKDETFVLVTVGGSSQTFKPIAPGVDSTHAGSEVIFSPAGIDDGSRLTLSGDRTKVGLRQPFGMATSWTKDPEAGGGSSPSSWVFERASSTEEDGAEVELESDAGYPIWIAQSAPGVAKTCTATVQEVGCRGLKLTYSGTGSSRRVIKIERVVGSVVSTVASYTYTADGLLKQSCTVDPDGAGPATPLCESYEYDASTVAGRILLKKLTPPGQAAWRMDYKASGQITKVVRSLDADTQTSGGEAVWTFAYALDPSTPGLPNMSAAATEGWGQLTPPAAAAAVFSPDYQPATTPTASDMTRAKVFYTDAQGRLTNIAVHGNVGGDSKWLVRTDWYDNYGNLVRTLSADGRELALSADLDYRATIARDASLITVYNNDGDADENDGDGRRVEHEYGPVHLSYRDGQAPAGLRTHTAYTYDDEAPSLGGAGRPANSEQPLDLPVEITVTTSTPDMQSDTDPEVTRYEYGPIASTDGNGWEIGQATKTLTKVENGAWSAEVTRYDDLGRVIEMQDAGAAIGPDGRGTDAGSERSVYYGPEASDQDCQTDLAGKAERLEWVGLLCKIVPSGQSTNAPTTHYVRYDAGQRPLETLVVGPGTTRRSSAAYDALGRITQTIVTDGVDTRVHSVAYDPTSGLTTGNTGVGADIHTSYDSWGRVRSYTDGTGMVSSSKYTVDGRLSEFNDGSDSYSYSYDGATGEARRLLTSVTTNMGSEVETVKLAYDARSEVSVMTYPNGTTASFSSDEAGNSTGTSYSSSDGSSLLEFSLRNDVGGRIVATSSPAWENRYEYDASDRLVRAAQSNGTECRIRTYQFNARSHRVSSTKSSSTNSDCSAAGQTTTLTNTFDDAGRNVSAGYSYDGLGRTLTVPALATSSPADGQLRASYYANGMSQSLEQPGSAAGGSDTTRVEYGLDATGRIDSVIKKIGGIENSRLRYRFSGPTDSPASVQSSKDGGNSWTTTRYINVPGVGMIASVRDGQYELQLADASGNVVATQNAVTLGIASYEETDEFGNTAPGGLERRYGWLGSAMRSNDAVGGLTLMGLRTYNPATGAFLTRDPVRGGNLTPYGYPEDPINSSDPSGACPICLVIPVGIVISDAIFMTTLAVTVGMVISGVTILAVDTVKTHGLTIPMPKKDRKKEKSKAYKVYAIKYRKTKVSDTHWYIWKYGITHQAKPETRPQSQLGTCTSKMSSPQACRFEWRAKGLNWYYARLIEGNLILAYTKKYGHCPPGHNGKVCT